jgi:hypothetical protein
MLLVGATVAGAAGLWSTAQMVGPNDSSDSIFPNAEVSPGGTAWIVWSSTDPVQGDSETYCVRIENSVQSDREKIHEDNPFMDRCPVMSMGSDGVPWVVWERYGTALGYEQVVTHWTGNGWAPADTVFTLGDRWDEYTIRAASSSDVWVAKSSRAVGRADRDIFLRHWDGTRWGETVQMGLNDSDDVTPAMTIDDAGRACVAWLCYDADPGRDYVYAAAGGDGGWGEPAAVDTGAGNLGVCDMGVCSDGRPVVVWRSSDHTPTYDLECAFLGEDGWEPGGLVNKPDNVEEDWDGSARLSRGSNGDLWVIWKSSVTGQWPTAITASQWLGSGWGEEELASAPDTLSLMTDQSPDVAVAGDGRVWAVWGRMDAVSPYDMDVYVAYRDVVTAVDVWGLSAETNGDSVRLSWQASPEASRVGFHVWRAEGAACPGPVGVIPVVAARLTEAPVRDCVSCSYVDDSTVPPGTYCYWLDSVNGGAFGPVAASVPSSPTFGDAFSVSPNPSGDGVIFDVVGAGESAEIRIHTASGRLIRVLTLPELPGSQRSREGIAIRWDGTDALGSKVPSGVYYAVLREQGSAAGSRRARVVLLR